MWDTRSCSSLSQPPEDATCPLTPLPASSRAQLDCLSQREHTTASDVLPLSAMSSIGKTLSLPWRQQPRPVTTQMRLCNIRATGRRIPSGWQFTKIWPYQAWFRKEGKLEFQTKSLSMYDPIRLTGNVTFEFVCFKDTLWGYCWKEEGLYFCYLCHPLIHWHTGVILTKPHIPVLLYIFRTASVPPYADGRKQCEEMKREMQAGWGRGTEAAMAELEGP